MKYGKNRETFNKTVKIKGNTFEMFTTINRTNHRNLTSIGYGGSEVGTKEMHVKTI